MHLGSLRLVEKPKGSDSSTLSLVSSLFGIEQKDACQCSLELDMMVNSKKNQAMVTIACKNQTIFMESIWLQLGCNHVYKIGLYGKNSDSII